MTSLERYDILRRSSAGENSQPSERILQPSGKLLQPSRKALKSIKNRVSHRKLIVFR